MIPTFATIVAQLIWDSQGSDYFWEAYVEPFTCRISRSPGCDRPFSTWILWGEDQHHRACDGFFTLEGAQTWCADAIVGICAWMRGAESYGLGWPDHAVHDEAFSDLCPEPLIPLKRTTLTRAAIYVRSAADGSQGEEARQLQLDTCAAFAMERGYTLVGRFEDCVSSNVVERPGLTKLLEAAQRGAVDVVLVTRLDRLSCSVTQLRAIRDGLSAARATIKTTSSAAAMQTLPDDQRSSTVDVLTADGVMFDRKPLLGSIEDDHSQAARYAALLNPLPPDEEKPDPPRA